MKNTALRLLFHLGNLRKIRRARRRIFQVGKAWH
jgi:hypothetical protein